MSSSVILNIFKPVLIVGALTAVGMGGYNLVTTGSPLGSCSKAAQSSAALPVSDAPKSTCGAGSCDSMTAPAQLTSFDAEAPKAADASKGEGCSEAMKAACETMDACPEAMMAQCGDAAECPKGAAKVDHGAVHCESERVDKCDKNIDLTACESDGNQVGDLGEETDAGQVEVVGE